MSLLLCLELGFFSVLVRGYVRPPARYSPRRGRRRSRRSRRSAIVAQRSNGRGACAADMMRARDERRNRRRPRSTHAVAVHLADPARARRVGADLAGAKARRGAVDRARRPVVALIVVAGWSSPTRPACRQRRLRRRRCSSSAGSARSRPRSRSAPPTTRADGLAAERGDRGRASCGSPTADGASSSPATNPALAQRDRASAGPTCRAPTDAGLVDVNNASVTALLKLPGVDGDLATRDRRDPRAGRWLLVAGGLGAGAGPRRRPRRGAARRGRVPAAARPRLNRRYSATVCPATNPSQATISSTTSLRHRARRW